jgi:hypothetical protein
LQPVKLAFMLVFQWFHACFGFPKIWLLTARFKVRVLVGEFKGLPRKRGTQRFTRKAESSHSRLLAFYRQSRKRLRQFGQSAETLDFDTEISGSEQNPQGFDRTPNQTVRNSRTLWLTTAVRLTARPTFAGLASDREFSRPCPCPSNATHRLWTDCLGAAPRPFQ